MTNIWRAPCSICGALAVSPAEQGLLLPSHVAEGWDGDRGAQAHRSAHCLPACERATSELSEPRLCGAEFKGGGGCPLHLSLHHRPTPTPQPVHMEGSGPTLLCSWDTLEPGPPARARKDKPLGDPNVYAYDSIRNQPVSGFDSKMPHPGFYIFYLTHAHAAVAPWEKRAAGFEESSGFREKIKMFLILGLKA